MRSLVYLSRFHRCVRRNDFRGVAAELHNAENGELAHVGRGLGSLVHVLHDLAQQRGPSRVVQRRQEVSDLFQVGVHLLGSVTLWLVRGPAVQDDSKAVFVAGQFTLHPYCRRRMPMDAVKK
jgi:hypothetical protein